MNMQGQVFTLSIQLLDQRRVMLLYELVESCLLRAMAFVGGVTKGILAWRQHSDSTPTFAVLKSHTVAQSMLDGNIQTGRKHYPDAQNPEAERVKYS